jgi:hypothetical protein
MLAEYGRRIHSGGSGDAAELFLVASHLTFVTDMLALTSLPATYSAPASVPLVTFDGTKATEHAFHELNDPVMGGKSNATWSLDNQHGYGYLDGEVVDVPSLSAPGFVTAYSDGKFADASSAFGGGLTLLVRSSTPEFAGFRASFYAGEGEGSYSCAGGGTIPFSRECWKGKFSVPAGDEFTQVRPATLAHSLRSGE